MHNFILAFVVIILSVFSISTGVKTDTSNPYFGATYFRPNQGGTGTSTAPSYGQMLVGNSSGKYDVLPTSSLGFADTGATAALDNLLNVAINTSLLSDANNTDALGTYGLAWSNLFVSTTVFSTNIDARLLAFSSPGNQVVTNTRSTIMATSFSRYYISSSTDVVVSSTPTIQDGTFDGQILIIYNTSTSATIDLQDEESLTGSNISLNGASGTIKPESIMTLMWDSLTSEWAVQSNPNLSVAGANADTLNVRNVSGVSISAGKVVYATGYNTTLNRVTINLADADDSSKMPAIGVTASSIGNNANGDVITFGNAVGIIDTSGQSVNDPVYVDTTVGGVTFSRPAIDSIQKIGVVTRVNASGNVLIQGAGRTNDVPYALGSFLQPLTGIYASSSIYFGTSGSATSTIIANGLEASVLNITSATVSSTFTNGIELKGGCIRYPDGSCLVPGGGGATTELDNLGTVAINTSLLSDAGNTDDLGSYVKTWKNLFVSSTSFLGSVTSTMIEPWVNDTSDLGSYGSAWKDIFASGTLYVGKGLSTGANYITSTAWTGTTTVPIAPAANGMVLSEGFCETDTGTVKVSVYDGTNRTNLITASTTIGTNHFSTNHIWTKAESIRVDFGTPASSPTWVACRFLFSYIP